MNSSSSFFRRPGLMDGLLSEAGRALQVLSGSAHAGRPNPAGRPERHPSVSAAGDQKQGASAAGASVPGALTESEQRHAAGLMRVNHVGEICAQALYRGQALFCKDAPVRHVFERAAAEEVDHLVWCRDRLVELQSRPSYLNPLWYAGSFSLGVLASRAGVAHNLGFMAETEAQVEKHLDGHLQKLPNNDVRSRKIVEQMRDDEIAHRNTAERQGAESLPTPVRFAMKCMSKVMTTTAYRI